MRAVPPPQAVNRPAFELLSEVPEVAADGALAKLYDEIKQVLGVSLVNAIFRALGPWPADLTKAWTALKPNLLTPGFETGANQIRAEAVRLVTDFCPVGCDLPALAHLGYQPGDIEHIQRGICAFDYVNPKLLLWVAAALLALDQPVGQGKAPVGLPDPPPLNPTPIHLVPPNEAPPEVAVRYHWLQRLLGVPVVNSDFQFLGGFPTYLTYLYPSLQEMAMLQGFHGAAQALGGLAMRMAQQLPYRFELQLAEPEVKQRLAIFFELLPRLILLVSYTGRRLGCSHAYYSRV